VLQRLDVPENGERKKEEERRKRGKNSQRAIQAAVESLFRAAMGAFGKMTLVIPAHLRRNA